jgi:hypothetical protein
MTKAIVRQRIEDIAGVSRTWFEWDYDVQAGSLTMLVVEVEFDTDPNDPSFRQDVLDEIEETAEAVLAEGTTMVISGLRVVPKR